MHHTKRHPRTLAGSGLALAAVALLAGCSSGAGNSAASSAPGGAVHSGLSQGVSGADGTAASAPKAAAPGQPATTARLAPAARQLVYTAQLSVRAANAGDAVAKATSIVTDAGGYVGSENLTTPAGSPAGHAASPAAPSTVQFKIPAAVYAVTLARLDGGAIGTRLSLQQQAQDVTQQVADVGSQVTSDRAAIAQLRSLLGRAGSVGDLLSVQDQISSQESSLESLEAQQNALNHQTAYATVDLTVSGPVAPPPAPKAAAGPPGLVRGLAGGWHAFALVIEWLLTALGAAAPFAAAAAVAGYAAYRVRRRIRAKPAP
jgi:hypothetical protein